MVGLDTPDVDAPEDFLPTFPHLVALDKSLNCPICGDRFRAPVLLTTCSHSFCSLCIRNYLAGAKGKSECPSCNVKTDDTKLKKNAQLEDVVENWGRARPFLITLKKRTQTAQEPTSLPGPSRSCLTPSNSTPDYKDIHANKKRRLNSTVIDDSSDVEEGENGNGKGKGKMRWKSDVGNERVNGSGSGSGLSPRRTRSSAAKMGSQSVAVGQKSKFFDKGKGKERQVIDISDEDDGDPDWEEGGDSPIKGKSKINGSRRKGKEESEKDLKGKKKDKVRIKEEGNDDDDVMEIDPLDANAYVNCPQCNRQMKNSEINLHLDKCLREGLLESEEQETKKKKNEQAWKAFGLGGRSSSKGGVSMGKGKTTSGKSGKAKTGKPGSSDADDEKRMTSINLQLVKDKQLRSLLEDLDLSTEGNRHTLVWRYQTYITLHNANLDVSSRDRKQSKTQLRKELEKLERGRNLAHKEQEIKKNHRVAHDDQFSELIRNAKASKAKAKEEEVTQKSETENLKDHHHSSNGILSSPEKRKDSTSSSSGNNIPEKTETVTSQQLSEMDFDNRENSKMDHQTPLLQTEPGQPDQSHPTGIIVSSDLDVSGSVHQRGISNDFSPSSKSFKSSPPIMPYEAALLNMNRVV